MAEKILVPFWRESAFLGWLDKTAVAVSGAVVAIAAGALPASVTWYGALGVAGLYSLADLLLSLRAIFFAGPDVFQDPPPPSKDDRIAALEAQLASLKAASATAPAAPPPSPTP